MPYKSFGAGVQCKTKGPKPRYCQILSVAPGATRKNVWLVKYTDDKSTEVKTSQQLLKLTATDVYPTPSIGTSGSDGGTEPTEPGSTVPSDSEDESDLENTDSGSESDPDDVDAEDIELVIPEDGNEDPEYFFNHQDLEDEKKHSRNTKKYKREKKKLLRQAWSVVEEAGDAKFEVGATVTTKKDRDTVGVITGRAADGTKWLTVKS
ncbi:MAG: hypothetical protein SGARI_003150 [Bacillariaceae sp.]